MLSKNISNIWALRQKAKYGSSTFLYQSVYYDDYDDLVDTGHVADNYIY